jgi:hypothetical protein
MTTQFKVGDNVIYKKRNATIINIINTKEDFTKMGQEHPLLVKLGFDESYYFEQYRNDDGHFPMIIIRYTNEFVLNIKRMNTWINENELRDEFNTWRKDGIHHPAKKDTADPMVRLRAFIVERHNDMKIPSSTFYDLVPYESENYELVDGSDIEYLMLDISKGGGRSRKRRRQYRIKKSRSRSRK